MYLSSFSLNPFSIYNSRCHISLPSIPYTMGLQIPDHRLVPVHTVRNQQEWWASEQSFMCCSPSLSLHSHHQLNHTLYFCPCEKIVFHGQVVQMSSMEKWNKFLGAKNVGDHCLLSYHIALCEPTQNPVLCSVMGSGKKVHI